MPNYQANAKRKKPIKYITPSGIEVSLYTTHMLADIIGRHTSTIYKWENCGILPKTFFVSRNSFGIKSRLYTAEQVDILKEELNKCQVMQGRRTPDKFKRHLHKRFADLAEKYGFSEGAASDNH